MKTKKEVRSHLTKKEVKSVGAILSVNVTFA